MGSRPVEVEGLTSKVSCIDLPGRSRTVQNNNIEGCCVIARIIHQFETVLPSICLGGLLDNDRHKLLCDLDVDPGADRYLNLLVPECSCWFGESSVVDVG